MLPEMSEAVLRALQAARARARSAGAAEVQPLDLLSGLTAEEEGRACHLLSAAGVEVALLRIDLVPKTIDNVSPDGDHPLAEIVRRIFDEARILSRSVSAEGVVSSEC